MVKNTFFKYHWLLYIFIILAICSCSSDKTDSQNGGILSPIELLPADEEISGWYALGVYDEADDYESLYYIIDGGAQVFIDNGFLTGIFQIYVSSTGFGSEITLRIYDQGNEKNAKAVYDKIATGIGIPWNGAGTDARIDESALASYTIEFWQKNFFVQVIIQQKTDVALNIAEIFASHISKKIG